MNSSMDTQKVSESTSKDFPENFDTTKLMDDDSESGVHLKLLEHMNKLDADEKKEADYNWIKHLDLGSG